MIHVIENGQVQQFWHFVVSKIFFLNSFGLSKIYIAENLSSLTKKIGRGQKGYSWNDTKDI